MTAPLTTIGIVPASDFPTATYESVSARVAPKLQGGSLFEHYAGSWNALAHRFHGAIDDGERFSQSLAADGETPVPPKRHLQEEALFGFFSGCFSTFEAAVYALYTFGTFLEPAIFKMATDKDLRKINVRTTGEAYEKAFPGDVLTATIGQLRSDPAYEELCDLRNVLSHRTAPGRHIHLGGVTKWKAKDIAIDDNLVPSRRAEVARMLTGLLVPIEAFVVSRF